MPVVTIKMAKGRSLEQRRKLVASLTRSVTETLDIPEKWVTVIIEEFDRENWATGGELHIDKFGAGCGRNPETP